MQDPFLLRQLPINLNNCLEAGIKSPLGQTLIGDAQVAMFTEVKSTGENAVNWRKAPNEPGQRILVVDDSFAFRERLARAFAVRGFKVCAAGNYEEAMELARAERPQLAVVDLRMPGRSGLELVRDLKQLSASIQILVLSGFGSIATAVDAIRLGAVNFLPKPADADDILAAFRRGASNALEPASIDHKVPSLARAEWEHIHRVLADCGGNISEAARRLGIHRRSLQRKLRKRAPG